MRSCSSASGSSEDPTGVILERTGQSVKPGMGDQVKNCSREGGDRMDGQIFRTEDKKAG